MRLTVKAILTQAQLPASARYVRSNIALNAHSRRMQVSVKTFMWSFFKTTTNTGMRIFMKTMQSVQKHDLKE